MKKIYLSLMIVLAAFQFTYAQWTANGNTIYNSNSGNVGIGTTNPAQLLDVTGSSGAFSSTAKANASFLQDHTNYKGVLLGFDSSGQIGVIGSSTTGTPSSLAFWNYGSSGWFEAMRLTSNGYLGIGTTTPFANLQVMGTSLLGGGNIDPANTNLNLGYLANSGQVLIGWNHSGGTGETDFIANRGAGVTGGFAFYNHDNNNNETQLMFIMGNGNVIIGKPLQNNSSYILNVAGNVRANQITVNSTGADFVFEPTYHLIPLSTLKTYLDKNHHLPEIASAKEMQTDGLNLGENQTKLLQKVEELTLYLIDKDKELKEEHERNMERDKENKDQSVQLKLLQDQVDILVQQVKLLTKTSEKQ